MKINFNLKLNIAQKLYYGFGIILLFIVINGVLTFVTLTNSRNLNRLLTEEYLPTSDHLAHLEEMIVDSKSLIRSWVFIDKQAGTPDKLKLEKLVNTDFPALVEKLKIKNSSGRTRIPPPLTIFILNRPAF
ncbi:MAG: hypothetical protein QM786_19860 [Breznakibacter sp.]